MCGHVIVSAGPTEEPSPWLKQLLAPALAYYSGLQDCIIQYVCLVLQMKCSSAADHNPPRHVTTIALDMDLYLCFWIDHKGYSLIICQRLFFYLLSFNDWSQTDDWVSHFVSSNFMILLMHILTIMILINIKQTEPVLVEWNDVLVVTQGQRIEGVEDRK